MVAVKESGGKRGGWFPCADFPPVHTSDKQVRLGLDIVALLSALREGLKEVASVNS